MKILSLFALPRVVHTYDFHSVEHTQKETFGKTYFLVHTMNVKNNTKLHLLSF